MSDKMTVEEIKFHRHFLDCYSLEEIQQETVKDICDTALALYAEVERLKDINKKLEAYATLWCLTHGCDVPQDGKGE